MSLTVSELKSLRDDVRTARGLVDNAFSATRAAGISTLARDLRHIRNSLDDAIVDLAEMQTALEKQPPLSRGGNE